ncbi:unnamed protein product [Ascophyllum nodosum]
MEISSNLTPTESQVLGLMMNAVKHARSKTVVRVAGGWVRDKLLGLQNEDIDIALDNCSGVAFAEMVNSYLESLGQAKSKIATIEANPEQSKHLETARMKIMGIWVDLVNLRTEVYRSDSRIPETLFGTAEEDALRRDFTVNALFYNVNQGNIEDMTGRGIEDLREGIIRTPLPAMVTFRDDPLRVLRAIRFAARFGFALHQDICAAARDAETQAALKTKVSRERLGTELSGMLSGKMAQPGLALSLLQDLGLCDAVYAPPEHLVPAAPEAGFDWARGASVARAAAGVLAFRAGEVIAETTSDATKTDQQHDESEGGSAEAVCSVGRVAADDTSGDGRAVEGKVRNKEKEKQGGGSERGERLNQEEMCRPETLVRELFLCAALLPLAGVKHRVKKGKLEAAAHSVVLGSLKLNRKEAKNVGDILDLMPTFRSLANSCLATSSDGDGSVSQGTTVVHNGGEAGLSRLAVGLAVREVKELWPTCVDLCCAVEICELGHHALPPGSAGYHSTDEGQSGGRKPDTSAFVGTRAGLDGPKDEGAVIEKYAGFVDAVTRMGLGRAWEMTPLLRGNELMAELQVPKGPLVGKLMTQQASWQLEHPDATRGQCFAFLREAFTQLT